ncbi:ribosomal protein S18-alanine N-acetyltransferase [Desulfogranum japonicum]|uniref:ribosomal protein S18-alanine N-acetyltransferase n=1 Tax=Desulfogranum japonicum TaxID=231447 RepID=UPI0006860303|nr:ribosomal protein S18-alanine N-acetyltransferase [Desulfogranum japonicum]
MQKKWFKIRTIAHDDLEVVHTLEVQGMDTPWSNTQLLAELEYPKGIRLLAVEGLAICGYVIFRFVDSEAELLRIGVASDYRRQGVGRALWEQGSKALSAVGATTCFLEVRSSNTVARVFYEQLGFVAIATRKNYYTQPLEDAIILQRPIDDRRNP